MCPTALHAAALVHALVQQIEMRGSAAFAGAYVLLLLGPIARLEHEQLVVATRWVQDGENGGLGALFHPCPANGESVIAYHRVCDVTGGGKGLKTSPQRVLYHLII